MDWLSETAYKASLVGIGFGLIIAVIKIMSRVFGNASNTNFVTNKQNLNIKNYTDDSLLADAVLGNKNAQFKIGQQYWLGEERIKDARVAYAWLKIAKENGSDASKFYLENTVYKQIDSNDANNSIKLYEEIKKAVRNKNVHLCELIINKNLEDRGVVVEKKENENPTKNNEIFNNKNLTYNKYQKNQEQLEKINSTRTENDKDIRLKIKNYFLWILMLGIVAFLLNKIEFIKTAINVYSPKNLVAKENNLIEINRMQEQEIKKLQSENEVLRTLGRAIAKNHIETAELNRILMLRKDQGPVPISVNGNLLTCINTGITIECN